MIPDAVAEELLRVLAVKLGWERERLAELAHLLDEVGAESPAAPSRAEAVSGDPDDDRILACAVEAEVEVLVSGDRRHLLPLGEHRGVRILSPQALIAELRGPAP